MMRGKKWLALAVAITTSTMYGGTAAAAAATDADVAVMESEIAQLTQRLSQLEGELADVKAKAKKAEKTAKKAQKDSKKDKVKWSGSIKNGYWHETQSLKGKTGNKMKTEFTLKGKAKLDHGYTAGFGIKVKATSEDNVEPGKERAQWAKSRMYLNAAYVEKKFDNQWDLIWGTYSPSIGQGLFLDRGGIYQSTLFWTPDEHNRVQLSYGRTSRDPIGTIYYNKSVNIDRESNVKEIEKQRILKFLDYQHNFTKDAYLGVYIAGHQPDKYWGVYGKTPIAGKVWIDGEYVRNTNKDKTPEDTSNYSYGYKYYKNNDSQKGYMIDLGYGEAKKKGDFAGKLTWFNVDQNLFMNDGYNGYDDYLDENGFKGFGVELDYQLSKANKLSVLRFWGDNNPNGSQDKKGKTLGKGSKNSFYVKLSTKF